MVPVPSEHIDVAGDEQFLEALFELLRLFRPGFIVIGRGPVSSGLLASAARSLQEIPVELAWCSETAFPVAGVKRVTVHVREGMPEAELERVFEAVERAYPAYVGSGYRVDVEPYRIS